jgi:hypothetical protein
MKPAIKADAGSTRGKFNARHAARAAAKPLTGGHLEPPSSPIRLPPGGLAQTHMFSLAPRCQGLVGPAKEIRRTGHFLDEV